ncbi:MAG: hypothetical protein JF563_01885 [Acidobacteriales bacterium]|jgi:hypothetical protein|nr:hypothetical protein [Terriglobales bacterium]
MEELECMKVIDEALQSVADQAARIRITDWVFAKYGDVAGRQSLVGPVPIPTPDSPVLASGKEIPGIAKLSQAGDVMLTVRDFKAKSANDAAIRLAHVVIWATSKLTGEGTVSSKGVVVPLLRKYRCYDGNTRSALAREKGIVREGDLLSLDFHAEQYAEKVVNEILDSSSEGRWKPVNTKRRTTRGVTEAE